VLLLLILFLLGQPLSSQRDQLVVAPGCYSGLWVVVVLTPILKSVALAVRNVFLVEPLGYPGLLMHIALLVGPLGYPWPATYC
jgi:hypothetical protein